MNKFEEYMYSIKIMVFDYLCDTLYEICSDPLQNFTSYIPDENNLFLNSSKIFSSYKRMRFYNEEKILLYYGCRTIPEEYRNQFIIELRKILCNDNYYNKLVKNDCEEGTYDDKLIIHFCENYAIHYISLTGFKKYYNERLASQILK